MQNAQISQLQIGTYGLSHGGGITGELIRSATQSWAGHAFIYVGNGMMVEGVPPRAQLVTASKYDDAIWAYKMPITPEQQVKAGDRAHALIGTDYDYPAYIGFALEVLKLRSGEELDPIFKSDTWRVCSALVYDCLSYAGVTIDWSEYYSSEKWTNGNLVSPAMLLDIATYKGWT
jgi:uncharacterized protein YycO